MGVARGFALNVHEDTATVVRYSFAEQPSPPPGAIPLPDWFHRDADAFARVLYYVSVDDDIVAEEVAHELGIETSHVYEVLERTKKYLTT